MNWKLSLSFPPRSRNKRINNLNFYFHTYLWYLKWLEAPQRSVKIKIFILMQLSEIHGAASVKISDLSGFNAEWESCFGNLIANSTICS